MLDIYFTYPMFIDLYLFICVYCPNFVHTNTCSYIHTEQIQIQFIINDDNVLNVFQIEDMHKFFI